MAAEDITTDQSWSKLNPCTDVSRLQAAIEDIDALSQEGFGEISAIAKLMVAAMQDESTLRHPENIMKALRAIASKADDILSCIACDAERVGCGYVSYESARRMERYAASKNH